MKRRAGPRKPDESGDQLASRLATYVRRRWQADIWKNRGGELYTGVLAYNINGNLVLSQPKEVRLEVAPCNLIGMSQVTVTPEMVGKRLAIFTAIECKSRKTKESARQKDWIEKVKTMGGIAGFAYSVAHANVILSSVNEKDAP
jgi:hypothetical protein